LIVDPFADDRLDRAFMALADPVRRRIIARLSRGPATVHELAEPFAITKQAVSKHIQVLEQAGLVTRTRDAQRRPVHLDAARLEALTAWITDDAGEAYAFNGVFHTVRPNEFAIQTFEFEGVPDVVCIESITFEGLGGGRSRVRGYSTYPSVEARDGMVASNMEREMSEGYERLDDLLARN
jgi:DNA-binding transcriptional ArsR family regulator